jgi:hypothetical protein
MEHGLEQREADATLRIFRSLTFDPGLVVVDARVAQSAEGPILLVWFEDRRSSPAKSLAAWWDFGAVSEFATPDPSDNAGFAKIFLEEIFHAGGPLEDRPTDEAGIRWAEMDWGRRGHRLPPVSPTDVV